MRSRIAIVMIAIGIGVVVAASLQMASYWAYQADAERLSAVLNWPNALLQSLVPPNDIGSVQQQFEGTPLNLLAYLISLPLGAVAYSLVAYLALRRWSVRVA
jgi:hypothetical protein